MPEHPVKAFLAEVERRRLAIFMALGSPLERERAEAIDAIYDDCIDDKSLIPLIVKARRSAKEGATAAISAVRMALGTCAALATATRPYAPTSAQWIDASWQLNGAVHELQSWGIGTAEGSGPAVRVSARMIDTIQKNPAAMEWSAQKWATSLGCGKTTIIDTPCWKSLKVTKAGAKIDRLEGSSKRGGRKAK